MLGFNVTLVFKQKVATLNTSTAIAIRFSLMGNGFHQSVLLALVPIIQSSFDLPVSYVGFIVSLGLLASAVTIPVWGMIVSRYGFKIVFHIVILGGLLGSLGIGILILLSQNGYGVGGGAFGILILCRLIYGSTATAMLPIAQAYTSIHSIPSLTLKSLGQLSGTLSIGRIAGSGLVWPLLLIGNSIPLLATAPIYIVAWVLLRKEVDTYCVPPISAPLKSTLRHDVSAIIVVFILQLSIGLLYVALGPLIMERTAMLQEQVAGFIGFCIMAGGMGGIAAQFLIVPRLNGKEVTGRILGVGAVLVGFLFIIYQPKITILLLSCALIAGGTATVLSTNLSIHLRGKDSRQKAQLTSILASIQLIGLAIGTLVSGVLSDIAADLPFWFANLFMAVLMCVLSVARLFNIIIIPAFARKADTTLPK
ncbi:MFS transporter [Amylibacter sp. SFDW26]|uniref:MFS transporter n=1 Tax=Amylibacter sp. SFDW26 TaxID=2652722 RepID=UPI001261676B|nr:MFS transporter [Amylibacter sp. SFDW26]KAB7615851.1 MFS transporter [Amylibacter sp. SFDW26]